MTQLRGSKSSEQTPRPRHSHVAQKPVETPAAPASRGREPPQGGVTAPRSG